MYPMSYTARLPTPCGAQFLGVEEARTTTVTAAIYCEVASLSPDDIAELLVRASPTPDTLLTLPSI
jgi:hypothetical protein